MICCSMKLDLCHKNKETQILPLYIVCIVIIFKPLILVKV